MDDLVPHIDRRAVLRQRPFDDLDGTIDAGTEAARGSQHKGNLRAGLGSHRPCGSAFRDQGVAGLSLVCAEGLFYTGRVRKLPGKLIHSTREGKAARLPLPVAAALRSCEHPVTIRSLTKLSFAVLILAGLGLAACRSKKPNLPSCPRVGILGDAQKATQYRPGPGRDLTDVTFQTELLDYNGECSFEEKQIGRAHV